MGGQGEAGDGQEQWESGGLRHGPAGLGDRQRCGGAGQLVVAPWTHVASPSFLLGELGGDGGGFRSSSDGVRP